MQKGVGSAISTYEDRQRAEARSKSLIQNYSGDFSSLRDVV